MTKFKECACEDNHYYIPTNAWDNYYYNKEIGKLVFYETTSEEDRKYKDGVMCCSLCGKKIEFEYEDIKY